MLLAMCGAIAAAGCASSQSEREAAHWQAQQMRAAAEQQAHTRKVEVEDDGLPPQEAPLRRQPQPDDPTEPYSPNYGGVSKKAEAAPVSPQPSGSQRIAVN